MGHDCFRIKGSVLTTFIIEFTEYDAEKFNRQLSDKIKQSPDFFQQSPVIIDFEKMDLDTCQVNYSEIISICRKQGLQPIAFRHNKNLDVAAIEKSKLAIITHNGIKTDNTASDKSAPEEKQPEQPSLTRIINKPVRSGQQIYAEGGDLIILGSVGDGAEVLADGNIHIYGTLRGRALAGVKGDKNARIFCTSNEAELVSITGHFLVSDSLENQSWKQPTQFYLTDETLHVGAL